MSDSLQCTYEDARRNHLRDGIALSTSAKVDFFEEMLSFALHFGARDRRCPDGDQDAGPVPVADDAASSRVK